MRPLPILMTLLATTLSAGDSAASLFAAWQQDPAHHPNIPDVSWAGYHRGEAALPEPPVVASVADHGAKPGDGQDDLPAFHAAIAAAAAKGGGAVLVPAGTWELDGVLRLSSDGVVLRGAGAEQTRLLFRKPLKDVLAVPELRGQTQWSWSGGLVWIGPANTWDAAGKLSDAKGLGTESWEAWRFGAEIGKVAGSAKAGTRIIDLGAAAATLAPGQWILLAWSNADRSLVKAMAGHPAVGEDGQLGDLASLARWPWPAQVESVNGTQVTLRQPLRMDVRPEWDVTASAPDGLLREAGIERLAIATTGFRAGLKHNTYPGWNGIYLNRCADCFVRDVRIADVDNGVIHAAAKNTTVSGFTLTGGAHHHATALRVKSHDNLIERFVIESSPMHGINTEALSSGNVWRKGRMLHGTFDSHRAMSFDLVRTDIELANDGRPGGAGGAGPFLGRRAVHWNIRATGGDGSWVNQPEQHAMGALVGVQGPRKAGVGFAMPPGDKGTIVVDEGVVPSISDLYEAQLAWRLAQQPAAAATKPGERPAAGKPTTAKPAGGATAPDRAGSKGRIAPAPAAVTRWNSVLADRLRAAVAAKRRVAITLALAGGSADVASVDAEDVVSFRSARGTVGLPLGQLAARERADLARAVAAGDATGAACAAFHLLAVGDNAGEQQLALAGDQAAAVRKDLGIP